MDLLARREHSRREFAQKLRERFCDEDLIGEELDRLVSENLQSDSRYAESFLRQRINRGYGPARIQQEMRHRGIVDANLQEALAELNPDWFSLAEHVWRRKFGSEPAADIREKARRDRFMRYRGFAGEHYQHLLDH